MKSSFLSTQLSVTQLQDRTCPALFKLTVVTETLNMVLPPPPPPPPPTDPIIVSPLVPPAPPVPGGI